MRCWIFSELAKNKERYPFLHRVIKISVSCTRVAMHVKDPWKYAKSYFPAKYPDSLLVSVDSHCSSNKPKWTKMVLIFWYFKILNSFLLYSVLKPYCTYCLTQYENKNIKLSYKLYGFLRSINKYKQINILLLQINYD